MSVLKNIKVSVVSLIFGSLMFMALALPTPAYAVSFPAGCPGGPAGPPAPGTVCPGVAAGCPGGPAGPLVPGTDCTTSSSIPAGCPGGPAGPKNPNTSCPGDVSTVDPSIPVRCQNIQGLNVQSACILQVQKEIDEKCGALSGAEKDKCAADIKNQQADSTMAPEFVKADCKGDNIEAGAAKGTPEHCGILDALTLFIKFLSGLVGIVVVAMIIVGGIQYAASGGDPQGTAAAKKRIFNAILALVLYSFIFALLQYLIPGGVL